MGVIKDEHHDYLMCNIHGLVNFVKKIEWLVVLISTIIIIYTCIFMFAVSASAENGYITNMLDSAIMTFFVFGALSVIALAGS